MICGFFSPCEFKAGLCFRLWGRGCSCAMEKRDCFPVRGAFWENRCSAYRSQPSKGFEGVLTSPLLKSFHPSKRATSAHNQEHLTCQHPTTLLQSCGQGYAQVHGKRSIKESSVHPPTLKTVHFNLSAFVFHGFIISVTLLRGLYPVTNTKEESVSLPAIARRWVSSHSQAHLDGTCRGNISLT